LEKWEWWGTGFSPATRVLPQKAQTKSLSFVLVNKVGDFFDTLIFKNSIKIQLVEKTSRQTTRNNTVGIDKVIAKIITH